ncbi:MAG: metallopeptidase TldD-related protein, partial [Myxococcota bacterium]
MVDWKMGQRVGMLFCAVMIGCGATPTASDELVKETPAKREQVLVAMSAELDRSLASLKFKDYVAPYFVAYRLKDIEQRSITGKFGSIIADEEDRQRYVYTEVRVGDYGFDNHANIDNEAFRLSDYQADKRAPLDENLKAIRGTLWLLTDEAYKKALSDYLTKKGGAVYATEEKTDVDSFSKETPETFRGAVTPIDFDDEMWSEQVQVLTKKMRDANGILDAIMDVGVTKTTRYLVTSEGTSIVDDLVIYSIQLEAMTRADDGMALESSRTFYARSQDKLPDPKALEAEVDQMLRELQALRAAPVIDPYTGPAILMPQAAGVLFHEAVGHRLEGERQQDEEEGRTFKGRIGKTVIPEFLSVFDDPTLETHSGVQLNGTYRYDDEGVPAERASLIGAGKLQGFLKSRTPIEGSPGSNGHGRARITRLPPGGEGRRPAIL